MSDIAGQLPTQPPGSPEQPIAPPVAGAPDQGLPPDQGQPPPTGETGQQPETVPAFPEPEAQAVDPAMNATHLLNVFANLRIIPEWSATLDASVAFPAPGGRGAPLRSCFGNQIVARNVQADLAFDPVGP